MVSETLWDLSEIFIADYIYYFISKPTQFTQTEMFLFETTFESEIAM